MKISCTLPFSYRHQYHSFLTSQRFFYCSFNLNNFFVFGGVIGFAAAVEPGAED